MENKRGQNDRKTSLLGEYTPAKASGAAFSFATLLPVALFFILLIVMSMCGLVKEGYEKTDWYLYASYLLPQIAFFLILLYVLRYSKTPKKAYFQAQKCRAKYFLVAVLLQIGLLSLSELNALFLRLLANIGYVNSEISLPNMDGFGFIGVLFVIALVPAVMEEVMFRGVLLSGMRSFGTCGAVLLCGLFFSLYHQNPAQTIYQFCCGACFALVAIRAGSILPTMLSHFLNNTFILVLEKLGINSFSTPVFITIVVVSAVCLIATLVYLIFIDKGKPCEAKETDKAERKRFFTYSSVGLAVCVLTWASALISGV